MTGSSENPSRQMLVDILGRLLFGLSRVIVVLSRLLLALSRRLIGLSEGSVALRFVFILFLVLNAALIYVLVQSFVGGGDVSLYVVAFLSLAGISLFVVRVGPYRSHHRLLASASIAFFDVLAYIGVLGLSIWGFIYPVLHPIPPDTTLYLFYSPSLPVGVYSMDFVWALLVVLRVALEPFARPQAEGLYSDIESTLRRLSDAVSQVGQKLQTSGKSEDPVLLKKVSSIMDELSGVREELSSMKEIGVVRPLVSSSANVVPSIRVLSQESKPVVSEPRGPVKVIHAASQRERPASASPETTESLIDNPWVSVLAERKARQAPPSNPGM